MTSSNIEVRKHYTNPMPKSWWKRLFWREVGGIVPKVDGFEYFIDGVQVASSMWDGSRLVTVTAPGYETLFGLKA